MPKIRGRLSYHGYISPAPGQGTTLREKRLLAKTYGTCRESNPGEISSHKSKCAKIAWSVVNRNK